MNYKGVRDVEILGPVSKKFKEILTPGALGLISLQIRLFKKERDKILQERIERQNRINQGEIPDFLPETEPIRRGDWTVASIPNDLQDRRVEITGPVSSRKMVINALNSGAKVYMADSEDSESPTWENIIQGQINLRDAVRKTISYESPEGKSYKLNKNTAVLMFRPRGWHLLEKHVLVDKEPVPASIFDFGLYFYHNAKNLLENGTGCYLYLPKLESHKEARLWNHVFFTSENLLTPFLSHGFIRATVLVETITAALEMDEILYELRDYSVGLNCGRWDYIFSFIKKFRNQTSVFPDRSQVTMDKGFLAAYVNLLIQTCHKRGAHAIGGMAAQIPIKGDSEANDLALEKVRQDKLREVKAGHDGTWVAHPGLVPLAMEIFDQHMPTPNQIHVKRDDVKVTAKDLLEVPSGAITENGVRTNISVGIQYLAVWLSGNGCVPINNIMEDAATSEICRAQLWQWIKHGAVLSDGKKITAELFWQILSEELTKIKSSIGEARYNSGNYQLAAKLFDRMILDDAFTEFLTLPAYECLIKKS